MPVFDTFKLLKSYDWSWLTRLKHNRLVSPSRGVTQPLNQVQLSEYGTIVHLKAYGFITVFKIVVTDDHLEYWASNHLEMSELTRLKFAELSWMIETYHRGIKQFCGIERCQTRSANSQRNHIELALRAFFRLVRHCFVKGISWVEAKISIIRDAVRAYLANPIYTL